MTQSEELELLELENENELALQSQGGDVPADDSSPQPGRGMGDLKMAESTANEDYNDRMVQQTLDKSMLGSAAKFAGNLYKAASTGPLNAAAQAIQDKGLTPSGAWQGVKNEARNLAQPFLPIDDVQSSETSLERAGVPNTPIPLHDAEYPAGVGLDTPAGMTTTAPEGATAPGLATQLGFAADNLPPFAGMGAAKLAGAVAKTSAAAEFLKAAGRGAQRVAVKQAKGSIPLLDRHLRSGADPETFLKEGILSEGKNKAFERGQALKKELGREAGEIIQRGSDEGETVDGLAELDALTTKYKEPGAIEDLEGIRLTDAAAAKFIDRARKLIVRMSEKGDGILTLKQAQAVKRWLQKQAEYPSKAESRGLIVTPHEDEAALTAAAAGSRFRGKIEDIVPEIGPTNERLSKVIPVTYAAGHRKMIMERQDAVSLKSFAAMLGGVKTMGMLGLNKVWKSGRVSTAMYKLGGRLIKAGNNIKEQQRVEAAIKKAIEAGLIQEAELKALSIHDDGTPALPARTPTGTPQEPNFPPRYEEDPKVARVLDEVPGRSALKEDDPIPNEPARTLYDPLEDMDPNLPARTPSGPVQEPNFPQPIYDKENPKVARVLNDAGRPKLLEDGDAEDFVDISMSASTSSIQGLKILTERANNGDKHAHALLQDIAHEDLKYTLSGTNARITLNRTTGLYHGEAEPSVGIRVEFTEKERPAVLAGLAKFAEKFNQQQIHVRGGVTSDVLQKFGDGSYATPVYRIELKRPLTRKEAQAVIDKSGLKGLTFSDKYVESYYVGDIDNERAIEEFAAGIERVRASIGENSTGAGREVARLWSYGSEDGSIPYAKIHGNLPAPKAGAEHGGSRKVAKYLNGGKDAKLFPQDGIIAPGLPSQAEVMKVYDLLPVNDLKNPLTREAYTELSKEIKEQLQALPVKIQFWKGKEGTRPYPNSLKMRQDIQNNNHLWVEQTTPDNFGPEKNTFTEHPLLENSGLKTMDGEDMLNNDVLRAVHDYIAHTMTNAEFGPKGELAAFKAHMATMKSAMARWALASETHGQNSWVNFRPGVDKMTKGERGFAKQKAALMPIEYAFTGDEEVDRPMKALRDRLNPKARRGSLAK